jgi:hypothetical protein
LTLLLGHEDVILDISQFFGDNLPDDLRGDHVSELIFTDRFQFLGFTRFEAQGRGSDIVVGYFIGNHGDVGLGPDIFNPGHDLPISGFDRLEDPVFGYEAG